MPIAIAIMALAFIIAITVRHWGRLFFPLAYQEDVVTAAAQNGMDPWLIMALIREESRFNAQAISGRGARGLMQIMPETGAWISSQFGEAFSSQMLFEPERNIRYGTWYLARLLIEAKGSMVQALAAYNAGGARVQEWLSGGIWDGRLETLDDLPYAETRGYIVKILRSYRIYRFLYRR